MPDWYPLICAARALNVSPIELARESIDWLQVGLALSEARAILDQHTSKPRKGK